MDISYKRFMTRAKTSAGAFNPAVDYNNVYRKEMIFCNTNNSLWIKKPDDSFVEFKESKQPIIFSSPGLVPTDTSGCGFSKQYTNGGMNIMGSEFSANQSGSWNLIVPSNWLGFIKRLTFVYNSLPDSGLESTWKITTSVISNESNVDSPLLDVSEISFSNTSSSTNLYNFIDTTFNLANNIDIFGSSDNVNRFSEIRLTKTVGTGIHIFNQLRLEF